MSKQRPILSLIIFYLELVILHTLFFIKFRKCVKVEQFSMNNVKKAKF